MARWARTIAIKDLLTEGTDAETIKTAADGIIERLPGDAPIGVISKARLLADSDPETALIVFNDGMDRIYDWADLNRIWLA